MRRTQRVSAVEVSAIKSSSSRKGRLQKPTSKDLDLLLLAGCSCLMTILYHPVAEALQTSSTSSADSAIATQAQPSKAASTTMNAFHLTLPTSRDQIEEEEEA